MKEYFSRIIDKYLIEWKDDSTHKPLLLRGARQVGKSSAARHLGKQFKYFAEINFERQREAKTFFSGDLDVKLIAGKMADAVLEGKQGEQMTDAAVEETEKNEEE